MMAASITVVLLLTLQILHPTNSFSTITMTSSPSQPLALNLKCKVKPTHRTKFLTAIQANQQSTRLNEPNNLQFVIGQDTEDENTFYFHEEFVNCEAFQEHMETEHFKMYSAFVNEEEPFEEPPVICLYNLREGTDTIEELALQYSYGESTTIDGISEGSANTFHFHEQYTGKDHGKEGFDVHASMPHFAAWEEFVQADPFEKDPEVFFFKIIED
eukprot:scaffold797_cov118-Skeletonema_dohrnii-CCMP3373.AAC.5